MRSLDWIGNNCHLSALTGVRIIRAELREIVGAFPETTNTVRNNKVSV